MNIKNSISDHCHYWVWPLLLAPAERLALYPRHFLAPQAKKTGFYNALLSFGTFSNWTGRKFAKLTPHCTCECFFIEL